MSKLLFVMMDGAQPVSWTAPSDIIVDRVYFSGVNVEASVSVNPEFDPGAAIGSHNNSVVENLIAAVSNVNVNSEMERVCGTPVPKGESILFASDGSMFISLYYSADQLA